MHQAWLEACHGADRIARARVRTVQPLVIDGETAGRVGRYDLTLIDLVGTEGIDAVVVTLTPVASDDPAEHVIAPPPRGAASFRVSLDSKGVIIGGTPSVASLLGRSLVDLVGTDIAPLIHPDDLEAATGTWDDVLAKPDQSQTVRLRLRHSDGTWRWFHDTVWNALSDPDAPGILCEFHDIHSLVEAEQALHASELGFRTLAESLPVGVTVLDQDGRVHFANHRLVTILTEAGLSGPLSPTSPTPEPAGPGFVTSWSDLVDPSFADEVADLVWPRDPSADAPVSRQVEVTRPDGQTVHLLLQAVTIWNAEGRSVIVSVQDVSEEVHTSRAHTRLIQVVDEVDDVVIVCQTDDTIAYLNQAARRFLGDDAVGQRIKGFMPGPVRDVTEGTIEPLLSDNLGWKGDLRIIDLAGSWHTMATTVRPVVDPTSQELHVGITMRDVTAERAHERVLARQARHDTLTGLPNRFALMEMLDALGAGGDPEDHLAVFFIDLDNLKIVNDGLGHSAGDRLLVAVADELQREAGDDTVARFGGDEFVVVCEGVGPDDALRQAERFLGAVQRSEVLGVSNHVSASIGVATSARQDSDPERLIRDADAAMYAAKRAGRARCAVFDEALRERVSRRFQMEAALRSTIERDGLSVSFQPIVSLADGRISGLEALCRWDEGSPADFIPIAEESGLILPLGAQVLASSLRQVVEYRRAHPAHDALRIGINVSARELDQPDYAWRTLEIIRASGMPMDQVVLELTESVLIDPREEIDACLRQLRDAGVSLALDDFGSGYSSLTYLRRYPLDVLKLDISYTQAMVHDPETRVIVETLVGMANRLGLRVVAEGVETEEQLDLVRELEVTWVQGYLVGRPVPIDELGGLPPVGLLTPRG
ncbi:MAG: diguanylate cyclase/phosphodiesterase & domain with sensor(s) [Ilumatobacteraceae bacterium]|nr:diguanylate cyclase/phosphodiesterase & domain with sensor(s) [Ilumatobacteraceae bacterium]